MFSPMAPTTIMAFPKILSQLTDLQSSLVSRATAFRFTGHLGNAEGCPSWQLRPGVRSGGPGGFYDGTYVEDYEFIQGSGDLDECNGRFGVTHEYPSGTYYYVITNEWPYMGRCFWGDIAESFERSGGPPPR